MSKTLVLAEKPSVGRELARVLGCNLRKEGYIEGNKYIVTWALGHLVTLADPEKYGDEYKQWSLETLPMLPDKMELVVIKETSKQFKVVKDLMKNEGVSELIIATDAGREGELVARWIIQKAGFKKPIKRLWISSQTDKAIKEGFASLKPSKEYDNLYNSAQCRAEADWLVGLNVTRALTCKHNAQLSGGRVQTPTIAMIVKREEDIRKFVPKDYYSVNASLPSFLLHWRDKNNQARTFDKEYASEIVNKVQGKTAKITKVEKKDKREQPPLLYDLTELQRDGNRRFSYSAKKTLSLMQRLYEVHKLLTYPRTDSKYISQDIVPSLADRVKTVAVDRFKEKAYSVLKQGIKPSKRFVDDSKVSDHHAIIPTEQYVNLSALTSEELNIYTLVVNRFLAALSADFIYTELSVEAVAEGERFAAKGKTVKDMGFKSIYTEVIDDDSDEENDQKLPDIKIGDTFKVTKATLVSGKTKAPARYTEATLLTAMEHPGSFLSDKELSKMVEVSGGLGTPATRADIIEKIFNTGYVEKQGQSIFPTQKGIQLINIAPQDLKSPELTAKWETNLQEISKGLLDRKKYIENIKKYASSLVTQVISSDAVYRHENMTTERCPVCGEPLLEISGKNGKSLVCRDRECGYRERLTQISNARCPNCHKNLEIYGDNEKKIYICKCGFKEKFDSFNQKLAEKRNSLNKREVAQFLKQQEEDRPLNNAFSEALKGLKLN
ncbi:MAG: DNA topoisomerase III [Bacillota bacterium]|nr:DNA topoisomerase III [Bacillota bacterium]